MLYYNSTMAVWNYDLFINFSNFMIKQMGLMVWGEGDIYNGNHFSNILIAQYKIHFASL